MIIIIIIIFSVMILLRCVELCFTCGYLIWKICSKNICRTLNQRRKWDPVSKV